MKENKK